MDTGSHNQQWAEQLIDVLIAHGVEYFCCAPGSRATPLALAIARYPKNRWSVHFDERGVCFHALGHAKATGKPAVVVTTSGTAVGNLLPGVMEAYNDRTPLILLTADRPPELRECGANQTCDQTKLFTNHVRWQVDLPCPNPEIPLNYLSSTVSHAVAMSLSSPRGPVHMNCMFREPLFAHSTEEKKPIRCVHFAHPELFPSEELITYWAQHLFTPKKGIILVGSHSTVPLKPLLALAERLQWPLFADILSTPRTLKDHPCLIPHFDPILKCKGEVGVDAILQFGDKFVSKTLALWLEKQTPQFYVHVSEHPLRQDPSHLMTHRVHVDPAIFIQKLLGSTKHREENGWITQWKDWDLRCEQTLSEFFSKQTELTEPGLIPHIASLLSRDWALFLSNSMPIRDANQFFLPLEHSGPIFGNRGVSGIDGNIATAAGIAQGSGKPTLALIGDVAFLHDLNSLAYLTKIDTPLLLCVVNNSGGGIFSFLPLAKKTGPSKTFETFFAAAHDISFAPAATLFGIPYYHPSSPSALSELLIHQKKIPHSCIIEITTERESNVAIHEHISTLINNHLNACYADHA
jgi:2-succinyl-5-enolpyruvyl-6-hydroxy-3-cyclohexene-1-carboxylate synthase